MRKRLLVSILAIGIPTAVRAEPGPADGTASTCKDPYTCAAVAFADALSSQHAGAQVRLDSTIAFEPGRVRVYSKDREKLMALAASWRRDQGWATIIVEGFADASSVGALAQQRAEKVAGYLVRYGVAAGYVVAIAREPVRGAAPNGPAVGGHVELMIERCPRSAAECQPKRVTPNIGHVSTAGRIDEAH